MLPKLLIVLGAGASSGYGPSTRWLTERLLAPRAGTEGALLFRRINQVLKRRRARRRRETEASLAIIPDPNFEELIQAVDDVLTHMDGDSLLGPFMQFNESLKPLKPDPDRYGRYASRARQFILRETKRYCGRSPNRHERPLVKALAALAPRSWLRLMSLNYDDLPAAAGLDFHTGFVDDGGPYQRFQPPNRWPDDQHVWCQLHGSLFFRVKPDQDPGIVRYPDLRAAARQPWIDNADWRPYQDGHRAGLSPMITGLRKADAILDEPFATYAHRLRAEALSCDRWLIIGYGGGDPHINAVLSQAKDHWARSGRPYRILVVGYYAERFETALSTLVFQGDTLDWEDLRSIWLFDEKDCDMSRERMFRPYSVSRWTKELGLTLDGVDWAMGDGLSAVTRFLAI
jgi:hypothetical protein